MAAGCKVMHRRRPQKIMDGWMVPPDEKIWRERTRHLSVTYHALLTTIIGVGSVLHSPTPLYHLSALLLYETDSTNSFVTEIIILYY